MATAAAGSTSSMYRKIQRTRADNAASEAAASARRAQCPFEAARRTLQRLGIVVYAESVLVPGSKRFVVGSRRMTKPELKAYANYLEARRKAGTR